MRPPSILLAILATVALFSPCAVQAQVRRIAIVVGNDAGDGSRPTLRYAHADADKMARALREVGEVAAGDLFVLRGAGPKELERTIALVRERVAQIHAVPRRQAMLVFYFSGHGDGEALQMGKQRLTFSHLKALLAGTDADVRLTIVDACQSGAAILKKGGVLAEPFAIQLSNQLAVTGEVLITSTTAAESALESSELAGSFFTHHLISGLRGAADFSGDKEITVGEAYRYAYERTVATTALTPAGTQHPSYKYELAGQGELVLASLRRAPSQLTLPEGAERTLVMDARGGQVVAEVLPGGARTLALSPGDYLLRTVREGRTLHAAISLRDGGRQTVSWTSFDAGAPKPVAAATHAPRGAAAAPPRKVADPALRLCVLPFKNLTGEAALDHLTDALPEAVTTDFGAHPGVRLIERGQLELDIGELEFSASKYVNPRTRAELGRIEGAQVVVLGSFQKAGRTLRVNGRFVRVETGEVLHTFKFERPAARPLEVQDALAEHVREAVPVLKERLRR